MLTAAESTAARALLRERAGQLRAEIRDTLARSGEESHARIAELARDMEDDAFADLVVDVNIADVHRDLKELNDIDRALQCLAASTYGICVDCEREISKARLEVQPTAERCIECQATYERTHAGEQGGPKA